MRSVLARSTVLLDVIRVVVHSEHRCACVHAEGQLLSQYIPFASVPLCYTSFGTALSGVSGVSKSLSGVTA
jgi:hypothetical protein